MSNLHTNTDIIKEVAQKREAQDLDLPILLDVGVDLDLDDVKPREVSPVRLRLRTNSCEQHTH